MFKQTQQVDPKRTFGIEKSFSTYIAEQVCHLPGMFEASLIRKTPAQADVFKIICFVFDVTDVITHLHVNDSF